MRIVFLGSGEFALPTLRRLADSEHDVPLVVTQPPRPSGRGRKTTPTPVALLARDLGLETVEAQEANERSVLERIRSVEPQLGLVIAFGQKLKRELLHAVPGGFINLHASLLPKYRGAAPINWAVIRGEQTTGVTVFGLVERMDAGPILATRTTPIGPLETAGELHDRLAELGVEAVLEALEMYRGGLIPQGTPQDDTQATLAPKLTKADGAVRFNRPAPEVVWHIHGVTPWPGASAMYRSAGGPWKKILIVRARPVDQSAASVSKASTTAKGRPSRPDSNMANKLPPGVLDERLFAATADGFVELLELKPSSGRTMPWQDYVNGRHVSPGDRLTPPDA